jgi:hypothetical protein
VRSTGCTPSMTCLAHRQEDSRHKTGGEATKLVTIEDHGTETIAVGLAVTFTAVPEDWDCGGC